MVPASYLEFETEDFSTLVLAVCDDVKRLDTKNIKLHTEIENGIFMKMDVLLITRLVSNLVSNAFTYGRENGNVTVSLKKNGDKICLCVADDSVGIEKEHLDKIWNRFYRVDKSRSRENNNSGLGLPMVKQIAELHSGRVYVQSEVSKGSAFFAEF